MDIGIIGGADGPTAIFISSSSLIQGSIGALIAICIVAVVIVRVIKKRKNKE